MHKLLALGLSTVLLAGTVSQPANAYWNRYGGGWGGGCCYYNPGAAVAGTILGLGAAAAIGGALAANAYRPPAVVYAPPPAYYAPPPGYYPPASYSPNGRWIWNGAQWVWSYQ